MKLWSTGEENYRSLPGQSVFSSLKMVRICGCKCSESISAVDLSTISGPNSCGALVGTSKMMLCKLSENDEK